MDLQVILVFSIIIALGKSFKNQGLVNTHQDYSLERDEPFISNKVVITDQSKRKKKSLSGLTYETMDRAEVIQDQGFLDDLLGEHNRVRKLHQSPPLEMSTELCRTAQFWADHLGNLSGGRLLPIVFTPGWEDVGGSVWAATGLRNTDYRAPTFAWYSEERWYTYGNETYCGKNSRHLLFHTQHFTQMIWKGTKSIGCGRQGGNASRHVFIVCHYRPRGNIRGEYGENIFVPLSAD